MDRLEKLKANSIENPSKPVKGCKSCKKNKEVFVEKPVLIEEEIKIEPQPDQILQAYIMLGSPKEEEKPFINWVYKSLFNEDFEFGCRDCVHKQGVILKNYIIHTLKIKL